jgi:hypothetical protein
MKLRMLSTEQGAATSLYCATAPELAGVSGRFYEDCHERAASAVATPELARALWEHSESWGFDAPPAPKTRHQGHRAASFSAQALRLGR